MPYRRHSQIKYGQVIWSAYHLVRQCIRTKTRNSRKGSNKVRNSGCNSPLYSTLHHDPRNLVQVGTNQSIKLCGLIWRRQATSDDDDQLTTVPRCQCSEFRKHSNLTQQECCVLWEWLILEMWHMKINRISKESRGEMQMQGHCWLIPSDLGWSMAKFIQFNRFCINKFNHFSHEISLAAYMYHRQLIIYLAKKNKSKYCITTS